MLKHEYTGGELAELKSIYDESGEAGLSRDEMRALRKAGLVTQDLPPEPKKPHEDTLADYQAVSKPTAEPSKRALILAHCRNRIDQGQPFDGKETAEALDISQKTAGNIIGQLRKEGLLPAFDQHSPRKTRKNATTGKKKETMATATVQEQNPQSEPEDLRAVIAGRLGTLHDAMLGVLSASFDAGDKVAYAYACKLLSGEIMDLKANYSKDAK